MLREGLSAKYLDLKLLSEYLQNSHIGFKALYFENIRIGVGRIKVNYF